MLSSGGGFPPGAPEISEALAGGGGDENHVVGEETSTMSSFSRRGEVGVPVNEHKKGDKTGRGDPPSGGPKKRKVASVAGEESTEESVNFVSKEWGKRNKKHPVPPGVRQGRWTEFEHMVFIDGLDQHGRDWNFIAQQLKTRTAVQVRTHAQKYFLRLARKCEEAVAINQKTENRLLAEVLEDATAWAAGTRNKKETSVFGLLISQIRCDRGCHGLAGLTEDEIKERQRASTSKDNAPVKVSTFPTDPNPWTTMPAVKRAAVVEACARSVAPPINGRAATGNGQPAAAEDELCKKIMLRMIKPNGLPDYVSMERVITDNFGDPHQAPSKSTTASSAASTSRGAGGGRRPGKVSRTSAASASARQASMLQAQQQQAAAAAAVAAYSSAIPGGGLMLPGVGVGSSSSSAAAGGGTAGPASGLPTSISGLVAWQAQQEILQQNLFDRIYLQALQLTQQQQQQQQQQDQKPRPAAPGGGLGVAGLGVAGLGDLAPAKTARSFLEAVLGGDSTGADALVKVLGVETVDDLRLVDEAMADEASKAAGLKLVPVKKVKVALADLRKAPVAGDASRQQAGAPPPAAIINAPCAPASSLGAADLGAGGVGGGQAGRGGTTGVTAPPAWPVAADSAVVQAMARAAAEKNMSVSVPASMQLSKGGRGKCGAQLKFP
eukprot:g3434.t1